jgi:DNA-directed RNA polymerase subunit RPC12/RpoP
MAKQYERCPACGKKGLYLSHGYPYWGDGTKVCRYCNHAVKPK